MQISELKVGMRIRVMKPAPASNCEYAQRLYNEWKPYWAIVEGIVRISAAYHSTYWMRRTTEGWQEVSLNSYQVNLKREGTEEYTWNLPDALSKGNSYGQWIKSIEEATASIVIP